MMDEGGARIKRKMAVARPQRLHSTPRPAPVISSFARLNCSMFPTLPDQKYRVLVIDPPWRQSFDFYGSRRSGRKTPKPGKRYTLMSLEEIKSLPIDACLLDSALVFLWATQPTLKAAFHVVSEWGLKYRLLMVWNKIRRCGHDHGGTPSGYPRYNTEFVLVATKGDGRFRSTRGLKAGFTGVAGHHSRKPDEFYQMIRKATAPPRLDMFNRRPIPGFDGWGLEAGTDAGKSRHAYINKGLCFPDCEGAGNGCVKMARRAGECTAICGRFSVQMGKGASRKS